MKFRIFGSCLCVTAACALWACSPASSSGNGGISFPSDAEIASALEKQFAQDRNSAAARELIRTLGGAEGKLRYQVRDVIYRQGAYEARYDAVLVMGQAGEESLRTLYASMVPEAERSKLPTTLEAYESWLKEQAAKNNKNGPREAQGLADTLAVLADCYREAKQGSEVTVIEGLGALLSPARSGLFAEKLALPDTALRCLPA